VLIPSGASVAGRLDFPALPLGLGPSVEDRAPKRTILTDFRTLGVFPSSRPARTEVRAIDPRDLGFVFRALATPLEPCSRRDESRPVPPLLALPAFRPFAVLLLRPLPVRGLPKQLVSLRVGSSRSRPCSALVVSHHLDGFLRNRPAGLLRPATGRGVRRVLVRDRHPSKGSPRQQPYCITAAVAPSPFLRPRGVAPLANPLSLPHHC